MSTKKKTSDFHKIWYTAADLELYDPCHVTKYDFFKLKVADGRHIRQVALLSQRGRAMLCVCQ